MFKQRVVLSFLLLAAMIPYQGIISVQAQSPESGVNSTKRNFVNLSIDQIKFLGNTGDIVGQGEFRLIILASDSNGKSSGMFCPGNAPIKVQKESVIDSPCLFGPSFDEDTVSNGVYIMIMAVDEDKSTLPTDISYEVASSTLGYFFGQAVKGEAIKLGVAAAAAESAPFAIAVGAIFSFASGKMRDWLQGADIIGSQGIYLTKKDNWSADKTTTVTTKDGALRITYTVYHTVSTPSTVKSPILGAQTKNSSSSSSQSSSKTSTSLSYWCDDLSLVKLKVGDNAKVVWMKVNLRTAPVVPMNYYENSIAKVAEDTKLTIIGGPACSHEGTWWQVRMQNGTIGWMREHISSGYLIAKQ